MNNVKVCVLTGGTGAREYSILEKYASQGCRIAFMDTNKVSPGIPSRSSGAYKIYETRFMSFG